MQMDSLTIGEAKQVASMFNALPGSPSHPFVIGQAYFIQTVTHYFTGRLVEVHAAELVLTDAAWIADTGRLTQALQNGEFSEIEIIPAPLILARGAIVTAMPFNHPLPKAQK